MNATAARMFFFTVILLLRHQAANPGMLAAGSSGSVDSQSNVATRLPTGPSFAAARD
jgi:hypothetical protein